MGLILKTSVSAIFGFMLPIWMEIFIISEIGLDWNVTAYFTEETVHMD
jgi:hypothetical protein